MCKIIAVMPIKLNNERFPGKNTMILGDKPLLQYGLDALKTAGLGGSIYVYCSDDSIESYLSEGCKFLKRPEVLDLPTSNFSQIFEQFMKTVDADIYVYEHATAPFVSGRTIKECISKVVSGEYDSAFCASRIQDYLWEDGKPLNFDAENLPRSQDLKVIYRETSGVYVFRKNVFLKYHRRIGLHPYVKEVTYREAVDINNPDDFQLAEALLSYDF
ncbi:cytidylyltransferase domain-containing protein [Enterocloster aldenensis]|uniref:acylneuraminate cytidylyltransferase family protein n=1 Tax=Enterocloster aldenensis TaxID=358742 RepID=UPI00402A5864